MDGAPVRGIFNFQFFPVSEITRKDDDMSSFFGIHFVKFKIYKFCFN